MNIHQAVKQFHEAMGIPVAETPTIPKDERIRLRASLIAEEFFETMRALFDDPFFLNDAENSVRIAIRDGDTNVDLPELADGLCDLAYVIEGTNLEFGIPGEAVLEEVQRSNLAKVGGPVSPTGKQLKPEGWTPPDIASVLTRHGAKL